MKLVIIFLLSVSIALAGFDQRPPNFNVGNQRAVFVDFESATYDINYQADNQAAVVKTEITFYQAEKGYPIFDLKIKPMSVNMGMEYVGQTLVSPPGQVTSFRMLQKELNPGTHTISILSQLKSGTRYDTKRKNWHSVSSAFFIRDLKDRMFLEKYLPTNLEYDQYQMTMNVSVSGTKRFHSLFANGKVTKHSEFKYTVVFPDWYTSSSVFFHFVPINKFVRWYLKYPSIDGRQIPVTIYSSYRFYNHYVKKKAWTVMKELEADYGPWPHEKLIIYGTGIKGGMEYAGATETSIISLGHELQHAYFAKGLHPANGNAGWMDEAIASWRDKGHQSFDKPFYHSANLGAQNIYTRKTDKRSYEYGRSFMAYLDYQLKDISLPGLKDFLRIYFDKRKYTTVTTQDFKSDLEDYARMSFDSDFFQYIYGGNKTSHKHDHSHENPHHPTITQEQIDSIL